MKDTPFLIEYINSYSPSGFENDSQQKWVNYISPFIDELNVDKYGNAIGILKSNREFNVAFSAHVDEVSFMISYIDNTGMISVIKNGGSDHLLASGSRVKIHTSLDTLVDGIFGWPSVTTRTDGKETQPSIESIFIDCGLSKKELIKLGVEVGCPITYPSNFQIVGKYYTGKGLDNKIGGFVLSQVLKNIKDNNMSHDSNLLFINTVQEEVGLKGSQIISNNNLLDVVITVDVTHDTNYPMMSKKKYGDICCGKGPVITVSPTTQQKLVKLIRYVAIKNNIPYQLKALSKTNTDTDVYMTKGIISALVSIPDKYMHSQVEMVNIKDVDNTIFLLTKVAEEIKSNSDFSFLKIYV